MIKLDIYRVEILLSLTGTYASYTSLKIPVSFDMAKSLSQYLKRQKSAGRIVEVSSGKVVEQWD